MKEAEHTIFLMFFDDDEAADGEVDNGSGDVPHIGGIVDEGANLAGSESIGWLVLRGDRAKTRIAAARPP